MQRLPKKQTNKANKKTMHDTQHATLTVCFFCSSSSFFLQATRVCNKRQPNKIEKATTHAHETAKIKSNKEKAKKENQIKKQTIKNKQRDQQTHKKQKKYIKTPTNKQLIHKEKTICMCKTKAKVERTLWHLHPLPHSHSWSQHSKVQKLIRLHIWEIMHPGGK